MITVAYCIPKPRIGGAELHLLELFKNLDRSRFQPIMVFLCDGTKEPLYAQFEALDIQIVNLNMPSGVLRFANVARIYQLAKTLRRNKVDIVHGYLFEGNLIGVLAGRLGGVPILISSKRSLDRYGPLQLAATKFTNWLSTRITAVSQAVGDFVRAAEGCSDEKIVVVPNGVRFEATALGGEEITQLKRQLGIPVDALVVGTVAGFLWKKGYRYFIETAGAVVKSNPNIRFLAFGDGSLKPQMEEMVEQSGLLPYVVFPGWESEPRAKMPIFDIYICASTIEGMSNALLEAMAEGRPVVATAVGGNNENVKDGVTGFLVPAAEPRAMAEKILKLAGDSTLMCRMGEAGKKRVLEEYTVEHMVARLQELYSALVAQQPPVAAGPFEVGS